MNNVHIEIEDETKSLAFGEILTTGSKYKVVIDGASETIGSGRLVLIVNDSPLRKPEVVASCELSAVGDDVEGTLDTSTVQLIKMAQHAAGGLATLVAVVHSDTNAENVASGIVTMKLIPIATNPATGAMVMFKGDRGEVGRGIHSIGEGYDEKGDKILTLTYTDGVSKSFVVPKGDPGAISKLVAVFDTDKGTWHKVNVSTGSSGDLCLTVGEEPVDPEELSDVDVFNGLAKSYMESAQLSAKSAEESKNAAAESAEQASNSERNAALVVEQCKTECRSIATSEGGSAGSAAASAVLATVDSKVEKAEEFKSQAQAAANSANEIGEGLLNIKGEFDDIASRVEEYKIRAEEILGSLEQVAESINDENLVHRTGDETVEGLKTLSSNPTVPCVPDFDFASPVVLNAIDVGYLMSKVFRIVGISTPAANAEKIVEATGLLPSRKYRMYLIWMRTSTAGTVSWSFQDDTAFSSTTTTGPRLSGVAKEVVSTEEGKVSVRVKVSAKNLFLGCHLFVYKIADEDNETARNERLTDSDDQESVGPEEV